MSSVTVDAEGKRVISDVLVAGYTHDTAETYDLVIPNEIISVIFMFWFIDVCDQWDQSLCHESVNINGQCVKITENGDCSVFGRESVKSGIHEWQLKFKSEIKWLCIGMIRDKPEILKGNQNSNNFVWQGEGIGLFSNSGNLYVNGWVDSHHGYCNKFSNKDTIITITSDMDDNTISYKINDTQYETVTIPLTINAYRLSITLDAIDAEIELL